MPRRVSSWVVPTQDQIRNSFTNLNKLSDQDSNSRNSLRNENKISTQGFFKKFHVFFFLIEGLNISKRSDSKYSLQSNDFSHINKVFKSTNVLAEDFRDMIKSDRKVFLQDYNKIENKLMLLMEAFKN